MSCSMFILNLKPLKPRRVLFHAWIIVNGPATESTDIELEQRNNVIEQLLSGLLCIQKMNHLLDCHSTIADEFKDWISLIRSFLLCTLSVICMLYS